VRWIVCVSSKSLALWHGRVEERRDDRKQQIGALHNRHVRGAGEDGELRSRQAGGHIAEDATPEQSKHLNSVLRADDFCC
jgi:hypothetical protein